MDFYLKTRDYAVSGESFELYRNKNLDMLLTVPKPENMEPYYASENYISHTDSGNGLVNKLYQGVKKISLSHKLKLIAEYHNPGSRLLDVGAGTADFVAAALKKGWETTGVEPGPVARKRAALKGIELLDDIKWLDGNYDVITLWHVLEHFSDLDTELDRLLSYLRTDGTLVLALPNFKSWDAGHYREYWAAYDVPRHLWHFSRESIEVLFRQKGFELIKTYPMWFDAFYISILSEKYQNNNFGLLRGFVNGLRSNLSAVSTGQFSSLIYVLKRI